MSASGEISTPPEFFAIGYCSLRKIARDAASFGRTDRDSTRVSVRASNCAPFVPDMVGVRKWELLPSEKPIFGDDR